MKAARNKNRKGFWFLFLGMSIALYAQKKPQAAQNIRISANTNKAPKGSFGVISWDQNENYESQRYTVEYSTDMFNWEEMEIPTEEIQVQDGRCKYTIKQNGESMFFRNITAHPTK